MKNDRHLKWKSLCEIVKIQDLHKGKDWNSKNSGEIQERDFSTFKDWKIKSQSLQETIEKNKKTKKPKLKQPTKLVLFFCFCLRIAGNFLNDSKDSGTSCLDKERELKV